MKSIVVAIGKNNEIGTGSDMPWSRALPDDLKRFRELTRGNAIIMGRSTFEHDLRSKPLPHRQNIVVTSRALDVEGVQFAASLQEAYTLTSRDIFVIGGGMLYASAVEEMDILYVTEINAEFSNATVYFPPIDLGIWLEASRDHYDADEQNAYSFDFVQYVRQ